MPIQPKRPRLVAAIIERADSQILIALPAGAEQSRHWLFPRGRAQPQESAEAAMRRVASEQLGLTLELVIGQPPLLFEMDGQPCEVRYFFCGVVAGQARCGPYAEIRWVPKAHLREYDFDAPSKAVVDWLLQP